MNKSFVFLCGLVAACSAGCDTEHTAEQSLWTSLASVKIDAESGRTSAVEVPLDNLRRAIRVSAIPQGCLRVSSATSITDEQLIANSAAPNDNIWRTTTLHQVGLFVLEGAASELTHISFEAVACDASTTGILPTDVSIESRLSEELSHPGLRLRLVLSSAMSTELDTELLAQLIGFELELDITVTAVETIADKDLIMQNQTDFSPMGDLLASLPTKTADTIDVIIGPCLLQQTSFGQQRLAGLTPRIPGGAGPADAVFIARTNCDFEHSSPGSETAIARLAAHEIGHYLGLAHPEELNGSEDDLPSTNNNNLMNRIPLSANATGLTAEQRERILAHPFVIDL
ncbi:hypothetical protein L2744_16100 [Shewanella profunda]|uniref:hypothetical protein n=1 Tax=Shewanella profunda TaxID=254793 RepID=UPI00200C3249|nr:hypothetical protein [Shewanella profunda]MCL1091096.1 hypothetical protein [Shewanella profunda]